MLSDAQDVAVVLWGLGGHMVHGNDLGSPLKCQILALVLQTYENLLQLRLGSLIPGHSQRRMDILPGHI